MPLPVLKSPRGPAVHLTYSSRPTLLQPAHDVLPPLNQLESMQCVPYSAALPPPGALRQQAGGLRAAGRHHYGIPLVGAARL